MTGYFVLAERGQVEDPEWWERHTGITVIVQCAGARSGRQFNYPVRGLKHMIVDPRDQEQRQNMLTEAMYDVRDALKRNQEVLLHCEQSFHRALVVAAAFMKRLTGRHPQAFRQSLSS